jgi:hypothetical protein
MFKKILRILAYIIIFIAILFLANAAWNYSVGSDGVWIRDFLLEHNWISPRSVLAEWTPTVGKLVWAAVIWGLIAFIIDPAAATNAIGRVGDFVSTVVRETARTVTRAVSGAASGLGWLLLPLALVGYLYYKNKKDT